MTKRFLQTRKFGLLNNFYSVLSLQNIEKRGRLLQGLGNILDPPPPSAKTVKPLVRGKASNVEQEHY